MTRRALTSLLLLLTLATPGWAQVRVGILRGRGVWEEGRAALEQAAREAGLAPRSLPLERVAAWDLGSLRAVILPGGWAPDVLAQLGEQGQRSLRAFVRGGGGCLAVCAGAYLIADDVRWEGVDVPYPLDLFPGRAVGPVPGLAPWPGRGRVELSCVQGRHPLQAGSAKHLVACYYGGSCFRSRDPRVVPLLRYPDGSLAAAALTQGAGRVVVSGPHLEVAARQGAAADPDAHALLEHALRWVCGQPPQGSPRTH